MEVINKREAWNKEKIAGQKLPPKPERPLANAVTLSDTDTLRDQAQIKSPLIPKKTGRNYRLVLFSFTRELSHEKTC